MSPHDPLHMTVEWDKDIKLFRDHPEGFDDYMRGTMFGDQTIDAVVVDGLFYDSVNTFTREHVGHEAHGVGESRLLGLIAPPVGFSLFKDEQEFIAVLMAVHGGNLK